MPAANTAAFSRISIRRPLRLTISLLRWQGAYLIGRTVVGRATVAVLQINHPVRVQLRERLIGEGLFPPP